MKTIGIVGGISWVSTAEYYKIINQEISRRLGGHSSAKIILTSIDFEEFFRHAFFEKWDETAQMLSTEAKKLQDAGADFFIFASNTPHKVANQVAESVSIPMLHIVDPTGEKIKGMNLKKIGLLGTSFTMEDGYYHRRLLKYGIEAITPDDETRREIHRIIMDELVNEKFTPEAKEYYIKSINSLIEDGAEGIILGCTEIPILINQNDVSVPLFDTTDLHARATAHKAIS